MIRISTIGRLAKDAAIEQVNGKNYVKFTLAANEGNSAKGNVRWITCWYGNEKVAPWLTKGRQIYIEGNSKIAGANIKDGKTYVNESIGVDVLTFLSEKREDDNDVPM